MPPYSRSSPWGWSHRYDKLIDSVNVINLVDETTTYIINEVKHISKSLENPDRAL
jgi:hypothetical protein